MPLCMKRATTIVSSFAYQTRQVHGPIGATLLHHATLYNGTQTQVEGFEEGDAHGPAGSAQCFASR